MGNQTIHTSLGNWAAIWLAAALLVCALPPVAHAAEKSYPSIRVAIDVSGSMKKNDPNNLRINSSKLLFRLLPNKSEVGLWMFAKDVNILVPLHQLNSHSKLTVNKALQKIHSAGLFTNIEKAISQTSKDWHNPGEHKILVLLSDGIVDLGKDSKRNRQARDKILNELIPQLQKQQIQVYTVALSKNADHDLLEKLALSTGGLYQSAENANSLEKAFFQIFESSMKQDHLPLTDNTFVVDKSIKEITLLIFHQDSESLIRLEDPYRNILINNGRELDIKWHNENGYDLITIKNPEIGTWKIHGSYDDNNRVMIASDLGLQVHGFPRNVFVSEQLTYTASLTNNHRIIKNPDFMKFVNIDLYDMFAELKQKQWSLLKERAKNFNRAGIFTRKITFSEKPGTHQFELVARSKTFTRSTRQVVQVHDHPLKLSKDNLTHDKKHQAIIATTQSNLVNLDSLKLKATIEHPKQVPQVMAFKKVTPQKWQLTLPATKMTQAYKVAVIASGKTLANRAFRVNLPSFSLQGKIKVDKHYPKIFNSASKRHLVFPSFVPIYLDLIHEHLESFKDKIKIVPENQYPDFAAVDHGRAHAPKTGIGWGMSLMVAGVTMVLAGVLSVMGMWMLRRRRRQNIALLFDRLTPDDKSDEQEESDDLDEPDDLKQAS
jgi:uncharacterized protein (TIGR03503 family)